MARRTGYQIDAAHIASRWTHYAAEVETQVSARAQDHIRWVRFNAWLQEQGERPVLLPFWRAAIQDAALADAIRLRPEGEE